MDARLFGGQNKMILWYTFLNSFGDCNSEISNVLLPDPARPKKSVNECLFISFVISYSSNLSCNFPSTTKEG
jgi:hypothetical protein